VAHLLLFAAIGMIAFAPPASAAGPSGLVSPDHIIPGSGDSFYVAHAPSGCGGWEIVHYFGDGERDPDFHCASPDSCDTGAGGAGLRGKESRGEDPYKGARDQALRGDVAYVLHDDNITMHNSNTGEAIGDPTELPTAGDGFASPPKSINVTDGPLYVVDNNGTVWRLGEDLLWTKYVAPPAGVSPDKFRDASVKTITSNMDKYYYLYAAYTDGIYWTDLNVSSDWYKDTVFPSEGSDYRSITFDPNANAYVNNAGDNTIQKRTYGQPGSLTTFVTLPGPRGDIAYQPTSNRLLVAGATDGKIYQYSANGTEIPWGASPTPSPTPAPTATSTPASSPTPTPSPAPTLSPTPTSYTPATDPPPLDWVPEAVKEALNILGIGQDQLFVIGLNLALLSDADPSALTPGDKDLLDDTYALVTHLGKLIAEADPSLVSKIEEGALSQELFNKALYTVAIYLQENFTSHESGARCARAPGGRATGDDVDAPLSEIRSRASVVEMTLKPGASQGSFTATFPEGTHSGEDGWRTHLLVLLLDRGTKKWERVLVVTDSGGTRAREGVASFSRKAEKSVKITVSDGLSYDWNDTAGIVRVAMAVMTIEIPDGAKAPTPRSADTGGHGCSVVWPLGLLLLVPLLFVGPRR
jgi:hypothetical protein